MIEVNRFKEVFIKTERPIRPKGKPTGLSKKDDGGLRVNREISASEVRVVDEDGKMVGVMPLFQALVMAEGRNLDLIEIAPTAKPPTCKIMDYGKWKYENKKKAQVAKKNQTVITVKEIQLRPRTDQHDLDVKLRHARRFLLEGDKVKVNLKFSGREMAHQSHGMEILQKVMANLENIAVIEAPPKMEGKQMFVLLTPDAAKIKEYRKTHPEEKKVETTEEKQAAHT